MKVAMMTWTLLAAGLAGLATIPSVAADPCPEDGPNYYNPLNGEPFFYFCNGWTGGYPNCTYQDANIAPEAFLSGLGVLTVSSKGEACGGNCVIYDPVYLCDTDIWDQT
ncbi:MAG: hypothetical protein WC876_05455 [Candidatus Thermoplasmatota archaeon]|jgi:hypothetical protein